MSFTWVGPRPRLFVTGSDLIREMMSKYRTYHKSYKASNHINQMIVTGIAAMEDDEWNHARVKLNPAFHVDKLKVEIFPSNY